MKIVIALGGNALGGTTEEQKTKVENTAEIIVDLIKEGHNVVITHGNGPQVGMINLAMDYSYKNEVISSSMPFAECGAMSEGYIGYHLQQALSNILNRENISKGCATVVTQVLVDEKDEAFNNPTKPIGSFYKEDEAKIIEEEKGYIFIEDAGRGYRRVVPSPKPIKIIESTIIKDLVDRNNIVIAAGGGGIPVVCRNDQYVGIDAVIDKDYSAAKMAEELNADLLLILTTVEKVSLNYNKENEKEINELTIAEIEKYVANNEFAKGSMLPKVLACKSFVENTKNQAIITSLLSAKKAIYGLTGTLIKLS